MEQLGSPRMEAWALVWVHEYGLIQHLVLINVLRQEIVHLTLV